MAACGGLEHIFEKPLSEAPTFLESLSPWKHIKSMKPIDDSSFTEIFGEFHFKESHVHPYPSSSSSHPASELADAKELSTVDQEREKGYFPCSQRKPYRSNDSFSSESLSLCTEGLGFESFDDVEEMLKHDVNREWRNQDSDEERNLARTSHSENHRSEAETPSRTGRGAFPPPISCIGRSGKPWVCFKSYREDGRFILREIRIPTQEFLHACRQDGRLKLHFVHSDDEVLEEEDELEDDDDVDGNVEEQEIERNQIVG